jgi:hypothetical protein
MINTVILIQRVCKNIKWIFPLCKPYNVILFSEIKNSKDVDYVVLPTSKRKICKGSRYFLFKLLSENVTQFCFIHGKCTDGIHKKQNIQYIVKQSHKEKDEMQSNAHFTDAFLSSPTVGTYD